MASDISIKEKNALTCPECKNHIDFIQDYSAGDVICGKCGLVLKEKIIDQGPDWRAFEASEYNKKARTGRPASLTIFDKGLSTSIDNHDKDAYGTLIKGKKRSKIRRLRKWNTRSRFHDTEARNLSRAFSILDRLSSQLRIPNDTIKKAAFLYRKIRKNGKIKGQNIAGMITAALYLACRLNKVPYTLDEFAEFSKLNKRELGKFYRKFVKIMNIKVPVVRPEDYLSKYCNRLKLSVEIQHEAYEILEKIREKNLISGRSPTKTAASVIYIVSNLNGERRTQREIAEIANSSEVTLRNRYKEIIKELGIKLQTF
jgi:transcription initiation factor TFIIB